MGILSHYGDSVTLVNRTIGAGKYERGLSVRYDGEDIVLKPGENPGFPKVAVPYAKKQNPLMGSGHPINPARYISLVGVLGTDDCKPLGVEVLAHAATKLEVVDRDGEFYGDPMRKVQLLRKKGFDAFEAQVSMPSEFDVNRNIE